MKGVLVGKAKYPPSYIPKIVDIPHNDLVSYCQQQICHEFHNYFISIRDDMIDVHPLLNDHMIVKDGMLNLIINILYWVQQMK
jgi:hypothetical protein